MNNKPSGYIYFNINFRQALSWNYLSLIFLGLSGMGVTACLAYFYNAEVLGHFNLVNAIYMILIQVSTLGIHNSVLMHLAHDDRNSLRNTEIIISSLVLVVTLNMPLMFALYYYSNQLANVLHQTELGSDIKLLVPALFLFSINKILLWSLNGLRYFRSFSIIQGIRYISIFSFVLIFAMLQATVFKLMYSFLFAEVVVFCFQCIRFLFIFKEGYKFSLEWYRVHLMYGMKGFASGLFLTLNLNVDLIILGLYVGQQQLGLYSFAAVIVIGLYQLLTAIRMSVNPLLANRLNVEDHGEINRLIMKSRNYILLFMSFVVASILFTLPFVISYLLPGKGFMTSWHILLILLPGVIVYSTFFPFDQILSMGGRPAQQTFYNFAVLFSNALLNFIFIPYFGVFGAAIATTLASAVIAPLLLCYLVKTYLGIDLLNNIISPTYKEVGV